MEEIAQKYRIGVPEMDAQHARWIRLIETFRQAAAEHMTDREGIDAAAHALCELIEYTKYHFASEEKFMAAHGYSGLEAHCRRHRELEAEVGKLAAEIQAERARVTPLKLNLLVTIWLFEHIMDEDIKYARHIVREKAA